MSRPLLLGEAPSKTGDRYYMAPLSGNPARYLCQAAGLEREGSEAWYWTLTEHFDTLNAIERYADAYPWRPAVARERWTRWLLTRDDAEQKQPLVVVCVGRKAADAVGLRPDKPWGEWLEVGLLRTVVIPHTSGRNLVLPEDQKRELTGRVLRQALERAAVDAAV